MVSKAKEDLPDPRQPRYDDELVTRNLHINIFLNCELLLHESLTYLAYFQEAPALKPLPLLSTDGWKRHPDFLSYYNKNFNLSSPKCFKCSIMVEYVKWAKNIVSRPQLTSLKKPSAADLSDFFLVQERTDILR